MIFWNIFGKISLGASLDELLEVSLKNLSKSSEKDSE